MYWLHLASLVWNGDHEEGGKMEVHEIKKVVGGMNSNSGDKTLHSFISAFVIGRSSDLDKI